MIFVYDIRDVLIAAFFVVGTIVFGVFYVALLLGGRKTKR